MKTLHVCTWWKKGERKFTSQKNVIIIQYLEEYRQLFKVQLLVSLVNIWPAMELYKDFKNICTHDESNTKCFKQQEKYVFISGWLNEWVSILFLPQSCFTHFCSLSTLSEARTSKSQGIKCVWYLHPWTIGGLKENLFLVCALWHLLKIRFSDAVCKWTKDMNPADANHIRKIMGDFEFSIPKSK